MTGIMGDITNSSEPYALIMGIIALGSSGLFFLMKFQIIKINFRITDVDFLWFFAIATLISGLIHMLTTIGFIGSS